MIDDLCDRLKSFVENNEIKNNLVLKQYTFNTEPYKEGMATREINIKLILYKEWRKGYPEHIERHWEDLK